MPVRSHRQVELCRVNMYTNFSIVMYPKPSLTLLYSCHVSWSLVLMAVSMATIVFLLTAISASYRKFSNRSTTHIQCHNDYRAAVSMGELRSYSISNIHTNITRACHELYQYALPR